MSYVDQLLGRAPSRPRKTNGFSDRQQKMLIAHVAGPQVVRRDNTMPTSLALRRHGYIHFHGKGEAQQSTITGKGPRGRQAVAGARGRPLERGDAMKLEPKSGFVWSHVVWGRPNAVRSAVCSYCAAAIAEGDVPLILWDQEGYAAQFCDGCQRQWFGVHGFSDCELENPDQM